nr:MAG TPA: hypothetical protein [Caudoviricetes sp.]DAV90660.1 MAG TPA: hypothetical protein [Caudoviricetes sp.]
MNQISKDIGIRFVFYIRRASCKHKEPSQTIVFAKEYKQIVLTFSYISTTS